MRGVSHDGPPVQSKSRELNYRVPHPPRSTERLTAAKFEIFKSKSGDFRFHLKAANGEIIASGQGYKSKAAAERGIESVKTNVAGAKVEDHTEHEHA
jgi:uncharacterized protein